MKQATILLVEDEEIVAADLAQKVGKLGYQVSGTTARGEEAVILARERRPDLVLMDIRLAGPMDGVAAAEIIRRECDLPVIYLTAHSDRATLERAKITEPFGYLLKPFQELELETHIAMALYKHQAERKLRQLNAELERRVAERTAQLRELAAQLTRAEEQERRRVAQVLHEGLQQMLAGAIYSLHGLRAQVKDPAVRQGLRSVRDILSEAIEISLSLTHELSPPVLSQENLADILDWLGHWFEEKHGLTVRVDIAEPVAMPREEIRVTLFRGVLELLFNVTKHARVKTARVSLSRTPAGAAQVVVSDAGVGFDPAQMRARTATTGFGLLHLRERLELVGGGLEMESAPGCGSRFVLTVPLPAAPATAPPEAIKH